MVVRVRRSRRARPRAATRTRCSTSSSTDRFDPPPRTFVVSYDGIIEADSDRSALLIIATDWGSGTFNNEANELVRFSAGDTVQTVDLDDPSWWKGMTGRDRARCRAHPDRHRSHPVRVGARAPLGAGLLAGEQRREPDAGIRPPASDRRCGASSRSSRCSRSPTRSRSHWGVSATSSCRRDSSRRSSPSRSPPPRSTTSIPIFVNKEWVMAFGFGLFHGFGFAGLLVRARTRPQQPCSVAARLQHRRRARTGGDHPDGVPDPVHPAANTASTCRSSTSGRSGWR